jgi:hypothetical protein
MVRQLARHGIDAFFVKMVDNHAIELVLKPLRLGESQKLGRFFYSFVNAALFYDRVAERTDAVDQNVFGRSRGFQIAKLPGHRFQVLKIHARRIALFLRDDRTPDLDDYKFHIFLLNYSPEKSLITDLTVCKLAIKSMNRPTVKTRTVNVSKNLDIFA